MWLSALAAVALAADIEAPAAASDDLRPRAVIYGYPSSTAAMLGLGSSGSEPTLYGALGMSVRLSGQVGLDAELAGGSLNARESQTGYSPSAPGPRFN